MTEGIVEFFVVVGMASVAALAIVGLVVIILACIEAFEGN